MEGVVQPTDFKHNEDDLDDDTNWHSVLHVEVEQPVDLAGRVQVEEHERVVIVEIEQLLEQQRRCDLRLCMSH